jgi:dolichol-phosphate mannosyltransferase
LGQLYPGWTSIVVATLLLAGFIILSTGITGLYVGKVFDQTRERPLFVVDRIAEHVEVELAEVHVAENARGRSKRGEIAGRLT